LIIYSVFIILAISFTSIIDNIISSVSNLIYNLGYLGIFAAALIETLFPIIPSELIFPLAGYVVHSQNLGIEQVIMFGFVGSLGSTLGAIVIYFVALKLGRRIILKVGKYILITESKLEKSEIWFQKYGKVAVLLGRLAPGVRELISIPAGLSRMNFLEFTLFTFIGSFVWSLSLTMIGYYLGSAWDKFSQDSSKVFHVISLIIIVSLVFIFLYKYYKKRKSIKKGKKNNI
jgi:membrane protein DedA with SNARE-associated domain